MRREKRAKAVTGIITLVAVVLLFIPFVAMAGDLEPSAEPDSTMHTLDEIYNKLAILDALSKTAGEVCSGNTFIGLQDDGTIGEMTGTNHGVECCPEGVQFNDNGDGTVTDCRTGLIWLKNANCYGSKTWSKAKSSAAGLNDGECGLSDGSAAGDWHLATKDELQGIGTDPPTTWDNGYPSVTWTKPGSPFTNVQSFYYWSINENEFFDITAWSVRMVDGYSCYLLKDDNFYVWPVRPDN